MNRITLYTDNGMWMARFSGSIQGSIMRLFGTNEVPTAYGSGWPAYAVLKDIQRAWPDAIVTLGVTK